MVADKAVAVAEHEGEANGVEEQTAEAGVDDALHQHVDGLAGAAEACLQHGEADLHAEDEEGGDQRPDRVDWVDDVIALEAGVGGEDLVAEEAGVEVVDDGGDGYEAGDLAHEEHTTVLAPLRIVEAFAQARELAGHVGRLLPAAGEVSLGRHDDKRHGDERKEESGDGADAHSSSP